MIDFGYQNDFDLLDENLVSKWLDQVAVSENKTIGDVSYVFCSDDFMLDINKQFLDHDTYTDIISFDYSQEGLLHGEIYISTDRVADNAVEFKVTFHDELLRVMVHGLLHLSGYKDKTSDQKKTMRLKEDQKIQMFHVKQ